MRTYNFVAAVLAAVALVSRAQGNTEADQATRISKPQELRRTRHQTDNTTEETLEDQIPFAVLHPDEVQEEVDEENQTRIAGIVEDDKDNEYTFDEQSDVEDGDETKVPEKPHHSSEEIVHHFMGPTNGDGWIDQHSDMTEDPLDPETRPPKCYGIALADSTDFGPYQAGALIGLLKHQKKTGEEYQVMTGVALGAINAYIVSTYDPGESHNAINELHDFWLSLSNITPYNFWSGGFIYGFFFEKGLYDASPLNNFIAQWFADRKIKQHLSIAVANILTGMFTTFDERHPTEEMIKILQASVSFAGISPAVEAFDQLYFSGNAIYENDVMGAINHCQALGYRDEDIIIDSIIGGGSSLPRFNLRYKNTFSIMTRTAELYNYYSVMHGVLRAKNGHSNVNFRHVIGPTFAMPSKITPFLLSQDETKAMLQHGERDAWQAINSLIRDPEAEIKARLASPSYIYYFNKERQARYEKKLRDDLQQFIEGENKKSLQAYNNLGDDRESHMFQ